MPRASVQIPGPMNGPKWFLVVTIWLLIVFALAGLASGLNKQWTPPPDIAAKMGDRDDQCESLNLTPNSQTGVVLEIQNTWSNAGYLLAGLVILFCSARPLGLAMGVELVVLAIFSGLYHATLQESSTTIDARMLDVAGIYFVLWLLLFYGIQCVFRGKTLIPYFSAFWSSAAEWAVAIVMTLVGYVMAKNRIDVSLFGSTTAVFIFVAALVVVVVWQMSRCGFNWLNIPHYLWELFSWNWNDTRWNAHFSFLVFAVAGGIAMLCRFGDGHGHFLCKPHLPIQPHAVWHVMSAVTLLFAYDFFAWSSTSDTWQDWPVFNRPSAERESNPWTIFATASAAALFGVAFVLFTLFAQDVFPGKDALTGYLVAGIFLVFAGLLWLLKGLGVIDSPTG